MKHQITSSLKSFGLELLVYAALMAGYYFMVLHFLGDSLKSIYDHERRTYAILALVLIVAQGFLLEVLTRMLLGWITPPKDEE